MSPIHYMRILSEKEGRKMNKEMVDWVKKALEYRSYPYFNLYNILLELKRYSEIVGEELNRKGGENK